MPSRQAQRWCWQMDVMVAERRIRLQADDETCATQLLAQCHGYCLESTPTHNRAPFAARVTLAFHQPLPAWPVVIATGPPLELARGECVIDGATCHLALDGVRVISPAAAQQPIELYAPLSAGPLPQSALGAAFVHALQAALRRAHRFALHSAGLLEPLSQQGVLVIGASGAGKTTLTMQLAGQGWSYLSDDYHLLGLTGAGVLAWPWRRVFAVTEQTLAACQTQQSARKLTAACGAPLLHDPAKRLLEPQRLFHADAVAQTMPRHLLFPERCDAATSQLEPLNQAAALTKLLRQSPWACYDPQTYRNHLQVLSALVRQCRAWRLRAGCDVLHAPAQVAALLAEAVRAEKASTPPIKTALAF